MSAQQIPAWARPDYDPMRREAIISPCGLFRYRMERMWDDSLPWITWVMLNASTADAQRDDATTRKVVAFSRGFACGAVWIVNLFAFRSPSPRSLRKAADPVGPRNSKHLAEVLDSVDDIVVAWGAEAMAREPGERFAWLAEQANRKLLCLGTTVRGAPRHPLYLPAATKLEAWKAEDQT